MGLLGLGGTAGAQVGGRSEEGMLRRKVLTSASTNASSDASEPTTLSLRKWIVGMCRIFVPNCKVCVDLIQLRSSTYWMSRPVMFWKRARCVSTSMGGSTRLVTAWPGASAIGPSEELVPTIFSSAAVTEGARRLKDSRSLSHPKRNVLRRWGVICPVRPAIATSRSVGVIDVGFGVPLRRSNCPVPIDLVS